MYNTYIIIIPVSMTKTKYAIKVPPGVSGGPQDTCTSPVTWSNDVWILVGGPGTKYKHDIYNIVYVHVNS